MNSPDVKSIAFDPVNGRVKVPKFGWLRVRQSREVEGVLKNVTITREGDRWYASLQTEVAEVAPALGVQPTLGIDLGVASFAGTSEEKLIEPLQALKKQQRKLRYAQRCVSRKKKGCANRRKAVQKLARVHQTIARQRADWLHKLTTELADRHPVIAIEDLKVAAMTASERGTAAAPGKGVGRKAALNRSILDGAWGEFRRQLEYKCAWRGGEVIAVSPAYTSRTCRICQCEWAECRRRGELLRRLAGRALRFGPLLEGRRVPRVCSSARRMDSRGRIHNNAPDSPDAGEGIGPSSGMMFQPGCEPAGCTLTRWMLFPSFPAMCIRLPRSAVRRSPLAASRGSPSSSRDPSRARWCACALSLS